MSAQPGVYSMFEDVDKRKKCMVAGEQINLATGSVIIMDNGEPLNYTETITSLADAKENEGVRIGKYDSRTAAADMLARLANANFSAVLVTDANVETRVTN